MAKMGNISRFLLGGSLVALTATPAFAEDAESNDGVIIVTAQKREQNLQEVPLAISAIGSEKLDQLQVKDTLDISGLAPNVTAVGGTTSLGASIISIRGLTSGGSIDFSLDAANAVYLDGIYIARNGAAGLDVAEIERVEVLRGPQGTLFGRNTTGGAISFISKKPSNEFGVRAEVGYGNYNALSGKIVIDTGEIVDGLKATFSYSHRERDGFIDNLLEPRDSRDPGARKSDGFRVALRYEPTDTGYFQYIFDWSKITGNPNAFQLTNVADGTPRPPVNVGGIDVVQTQQTSVAQYLAGATSLEPQCAALNIPTREYRDAVCHNSAGGAMDKMWGHNFQVGNDFGDFGVKLTAGYRSWDSADYGSDLDGIGTIQGSLFSQATLFNGFAGTPAAGFLPFVFPAGTPQTVIDFVANSPVPTTSQDLFYTTAERTHDQFSTELEISGDTDSLDWVLGGFYFWEKGSVDNPQTSGFVLDTNAAVFSQFGPLSPVFQGSNPAQYRLVVTPAVLNYTAGGESTAIYGQATVYPGGRDSGLSLTAGGRYTWDSKSITRFQNGAAPLATPERGDASFSKFTWNLMGRYELSQDVSVYARVATGYRSGGFNASGPVVAGTSQIDSFGAESLISYEIGLKSQLFNRRLRLNIAGYRNVYDDLAITQPVLTGTGTFQTQIVNAGKVEYTGVEADFVAMIGDVFSIDGSVGYVDVKYKSFVAGQPVNPADPVVNIAEFSRAGYTSPFTANLALNAVFPIGNNGMELRARVGFTHEDGKYSFNNSISSPFNDQIKGEDADLVDAQIVLDKIPLGGSEARIMIWGKNLTNDHNLVRGIDFGPLGYAGGYFNDPRTFGATIGFKY
ncbi:MAG: TonB-dependent receptor [Sphingomonadaceae bacterium]|nr:TonB-dependent receptor [Sphingomonadaceae bacterium]